MSLYVPLGWLDVLDMVAVTAVLWVLIAWLRRARARLALLGVAIAGAVYVLAQFAGFQLTAWLFQGFFAVLVVILVVVFQEDLRRLFERVAVWGLRRRTVLPPPTITDVLVRSVDHLAQARNGALIVLPGSEPLERHLEGGVPLDALVSEPLLLSIFDTSSPGHDGAVLIAGDRAARFAVHLPLSANQQEIGRGGTRHAAALGLAERTDCFCIVVSEERGTVSIGRDGHLRLLRQPQELAGELRRFEKATSPPAAATGAGWRTLTHRWREGALALGLTAALWVVRVPGSTVGEMVRSVPVVVEKLPAEYVLEAIEPSEVEVTLSGLRRDLFFRSGEDTALHIDALLVKLGRRTFQVTPELVRAPAGLEAVSVQPSQVRLSVSSSDSAATPSP